MKVRTLFRFSFFLPYVLFLLQDFISDVTLQLAIISPWVPLVTVSQIFLDCSEVYWQEILCKTYFDLGLSDVSLMN